MYTEKEVKKLLKEQQKLTIQQFSNYDFNNLQLSIVEITPKNRRNGKTTRCVDKAIQYLFKHKTLNLYRGFDNES